jgi:hypothetical protein
MTDGGRRTADRIATGLILLLGAAHASAAALQGSMNEDGIGYLDIGAAWLRRDWSSAISATWNPLYGLLLGPATIDTVPIGARLPIVHGLNFVIFAGAYVAFRAMWRELGRAAAAHADAHPGMAPVPPLPWLLVGHLLFAWAALNLIEMWSVTPDMLMAGLLFAAAALLLRHRAVPGGRTAFLFGVVLGLGYLAKPVMFPLGFLFLGVAALAWAVDRPRRAWFGPLGRSTAGFLLLALPWMIAVSVKQGEPTFGESGTLTYIRYINDVSYPFWTDAGSAGGEPVHPIRRMAEDPDVWVFGDAGVGGTYPPGFDPAYWYAGVEPRLDVRRQLEGVAANLAFTFDLVVRRLGLPAGALLVALGLSYGRMEPGVGRWRGSATVVGPGAVLGMGIVGIALYLPVLSEGRYLAAFLALGFGGALALVRVPSVRGGAGAGRVAALAMALGLLLEIVAFNLAGFAQVAGLDVTPRAGLGFGAASGPGHAATAGSTPADAGRSVTDAEPSLSLRHGSDDHVRIAKQLAAAGIVPGSSIGVVGWAFDSYWAWLADLRVVAEMPGDHHLYWGASAERRADFDAAFAEAGARFIVAELRPDTLPAGWEPLGDTGLAVRRLPGGG